MPEQLSAVESAATALSSKRRVPWIGIGGGLLVVLAIGLRVALRHPTIDSDPLHGDDEAASQALSAVLAKTPLDQQIRLLTNYAQDSHPGLRYAAIDALGHKKGVDVADVVEHAFTDSSSTVRQCALETLPELDRKRGLRLMLAALRDEDTWLREFAITQIANASQKKTTYTMGKGVVPLLIPALDDSDSSVAVTAANALRKLTGQPWRVSFKAPPAQKEEAFAHWRAWWKHEQTHWPLAPEYAAIAPLRPTRVDSAPEFSLPDIDGKVISRAGQRGHITLLNFWGTWCPPCRVELPDLIRLDKQYRGQNVDIIGIAVGEKDGANGLRNWCSAHGVAFRQALATPEVQSVFGDIEEVPVSVLIDDRGHIRYRWEGERDFSTFRAALDRLIQEVGRSHP